MKSENKVSLSEIYCNDGSFGNPLSEAVSKTEREIVINDIVINTEPETWSFEKEYGFKPPRPVGPQVLIEIYIRKQSEIIEMTEQTKKAQKYESIVGRVCKQGSACYKGERFKDWKELPKIGDWVIFKRGAGNNLYKYGPPGKAVLLMDIFDDNINNVIEDPSYVDRD